MEYILTNSGNVVTVFGDHAPEYVRTDRNGTKIYHDVNCTRCGGAGRSDNWWQTGYECYACGGTGRRQKPLEIKVYTLEYADKMEVRKAAKVAANAPNNDDLMRRADEARRNGWENEGFGRDGIGYLYTGKTYPIRAKLNENRGVWQPNLRGWIAPVDLGTIKGVMIEKVNAADLCTAYGDIDPEKCWNR